MRSLLTHKPCKACAKSGIPSVNGSLVLIKTNEERYTPIKMGYNRKEK
jgi:hypothetical protein